MIELKWLQKFYDDVFLIKFYSGFQVPFHEKVGRK